MPINLPQGLGNQFTAVVDTTPLMQFNLQQKAKRQAMEDATAQYFDKELRELNPNGVRDVHKSGIVADINDAKAYWMQNKEKVMKGGLERAEFEKKMQNAAYNIQKAKDRDKFLLELGKAKFEGKYNPEEDDLKVIENVGKSIYDKSSYKDDGVSDYSWGDLSTSIPDFDADKQSKFWTAATKGLSAGKVYDYSKSKTNPTTGQVVVPFQKVFSGDQVKQIGQEAAQLIGSDKSAKKYYNKILNNPDSEQWQKLNEAYQRTFGKDKIVSTPEQAAAADAIIRASIPVEQGEEQELNYAQRQADKRLNINLNLAGRGSGGGNQVAGNAFDDFKDDDYGNFNIRGGVFYQKDGSPYSGKVFITGDVLPGTVKSALKSGGFDMGSLNRGVDAIVENGELKSISNKAIGTINRQTMEGVYQPKMDTEPLKGKKLDFGNTPNKQEPKPTAKQPAQNVPTATRAEWKASGWTDDQINKALKQGKIKVK
jgi:hypothetical protein